MDDDEREPFSDGSPRAELARLEWFANRVDLLWLRADNPDSIVFQTAFKSLNAYIETTRMEVENDES